MEFDFVQHRLVILASDGDLRLLPLVPMTVADFYRFGQILIGRKYASASQRIADNLALQRVQTAGAHVVSEVRPYSIQVAKSKRGCRYEGDLVFTANGLVQLPPSLRQVHICELKRLKVS